MSFVFSDHQKGHVRSCSELMLQVFLPSLSTSYAAYRRHSCSLTHALRERNIV